MLLRHIPLFILQLLMSCHNTETKPKSKTSRPLKQNNKDTLPYQQFLFSIDSTRFSFQKTYSENPENAMSQAKEYFIQIIGSDLYNYWKGTPWDYNGTTMIPQKGKIACGYFVTTLLKDAGVKLDRHKLAICPSLTMMKELTSAKSIKNLSSLSFNEFSNWLKQYGKSAFIVGLDFHTGFIVKDGNECWFIHSNYIYKTGVVKKGK